MPLSSCALHLAPKYNRNTKLFIFAGLLTITYLYILSSGQESDFENNLYLPSETTVQEAINNVAKDSRYAEMYRKKDRLPRNLKYVLLWTPAAWAPFYFFGNGQKAFIERNCSQINCYVTTDRNFFGGDLTKFDVVAFNGRNLGKSYSDFPDQRHPRQKYIYFNMESNDNYPVCDAKFDNFFNWTSTYRLDSDIPLAYIKVKNNLGEVVGPKKNMKWLDNMVNTDESLVNHFYNKSKAAAWFVSNCKSRSRREKLAAKLQGELRRFGREVDVYGSCGPLKCPRNQKAECCSMLERDYYFYLSFENSLAEDYVTEKVLTALNHTAIPIVYGGANYSRFLPPSSYINSQDYSIEDLAEYMNTLMLNVHEYKKYFNWHPYYVFDNPSENANVCDLCKALNGDSIHASSTYTDFRFWWNHDYKKLCSG